MYIRGRKPKKTSIMITVHKRCSFGTEHVDTPDA